MCKIIPRLVWYKNWDAISHRYTHLCSTINANYSIQLEGEYYHVHAELWDGTELDYGEYLTLSYAKEKCRFIEMGLAQ